jgi:hypothetical protein
MTDNYVDTPVCIDEYGDGVYRRTYEDGEWDAIEKYSGTVIPE